MKKLLLLMFTLPAAVLGGATALHYLLPPERRTQVRERLAHMPGTIMERCVASMPDDSPPKVLMSGVRRIQDQNDAIIAYLREQNDLLRLGAGGPQISSP